MVCQQLPLFPLTLLEVAGKLGAVFQIASTGAFMSRLYSRMPATHGRVRVFDLQAESFGLFGELGRSFLEGLQCFCGCAVRSMNATFFDVCQALGYTAIHGRLRREGTDDEHAHLAAIAVNTVAADRLVR